MKGKADFTFDENKSEYIVQIKKRVFPLWWLVLLLLPLALFIPINKDIDFKLVNIKDNKPIEDIKLTLSYDESGQAKSVDKKTNSSGEVSFNLIKVRLYNLIFGTNTDKIKITYNTINNCYVDFSGENTHSALQKNNPNILKIAPKIEPILFKVVSLNDSNFLIPNASVNISATLANGEKVSFEAKSDSSGIAHFNTIPTCSNIYTRGIKNGYYPDSIESLAVVDLLKNDNKRILKLKPITYTLDIVLCIDATGSMGKLISNVKSNALKFYDDLQKSLKEKDKAAKNIRVKVIGFRDFYSDPIPLIESDFFNLPEQKTQYSSAVNKIKALGGGDLPESGLEALIIALKSKWNTNADNTRQIIVMWTDATAHKLEKKSKPSRYPKGLPKTFEELTTYWNTLNKSAKIVIYAPEKAYPWNTMSADWKNILYYPSVAGFGMRDIKYQQMIDAIADGI